MTTTTATTRELLHHPLCPASRFIRLVLAEKQIPIQLTVEEFWRRRPEFLVLSPAGDLPVLKEITTGALADALAIAEYVEETSSTPPLLPAQPRARAEVRRLLQWFMHRLRAEVVTPLLHEKLWKRLAAAGTPDTFVMRAASQNLYYHLAYIQYLAERRSFLAGDTLSLADLAAAAMLSSLDYLGAVPWDLASQNNFTEAKNWYAKIKSRPAFRSLLADHIPGLPAAPHYTNLDF